jgi:hemerythrin-like domain-containing protein
MVSPTFPLPTFGTMDTKQPRVKVAEGAALFDRREMVAVHDMLRREFALLPALVADVRVGASNRVQTVGIHIDGVTTVLHHHHQAEDDYVWPVLVDRCDDSAVALMGRMEEQHLELAGRLDAAKTALSTWRAISSAASRHALVDALRGLIPPLEQHLTDEEECVVPLMEQHITVVEWNEMVRRGTANADPAGLPLGIGMMMYEGDPDVIDHTIESLPQEIRPVIRQLAAKAFADHSTLVHGTATPPRSTELRAR